MLVDSGAGISGWLQLQPCCLRCVGTREAITPARFGALLGDPGLVQADGAEAAVADHAPLPPVPDESATSLSLLAAEVALLQARVDSLQAQLARLTD